MGRAADNFLGRRCDRVDSAGGARKCSARAADDNKAGRNSSCSIERAQLSFLTNPQRVPFQLPTAFTDYVLLAVVVEGVHTGASVVETVRTTVVVDQSPPERQRWETNITGSWPNTGAKTATETQHRPSAANATEHTLLGHLGVGVSDSGLFLSRRASSVQCLHSDG